MANRIDPTRPVDEEARAIARDLMRTARFAALGVLDPESGAPFVSRIALAATPSGVMTLVSDLSIHTRALRADPRASLLVGEPGAKGDPLTHPRLTLRCDARFLDPDPAYRADLRAAWLALHPKAQLYVDFADFRFVAFDLQDGHLNAGFGKAYALDRNDLTVK